MSGIAAEQTPAATPSPATTTPAATPSPAGVRPALGSFAAKLAASRPAVSPATIPTQTPPAAPTVAPATPVVIAPAVAARVAEVPATAAVAPATPVLGKGGTPIPGEAVSTRIERERNRILRGEYGTTDPTEIAKIKSLRAARETEYTTLKQKQDEADRLAMSEAERNQADRAALEAENAALKSRLSEMETGQVVSEQTKELTRLAGQHIDPTMVDYALSDFQRHINKLDPKELKRVTPRYIDRWFAKLAEEKPRFQIIADPVADSTLGTAAIAAPATVTTAKPPVRKIPLTTSLLPKGGAPKPAPKRPEAGTIAGKTIKPGLPNSMTGPELRKHLRDQGRQPW